MAEMTLEDFIQSGMERYVSDQVKSEYFTALYSTEQRLKREILGKINITETDDIYPRIDLKFRIIDEVYQEIEDLDLVDPDQFNWYEMALSAWTEYMVARYSFQEPLYSALYENDEVFEKVEENYHDNLEGGHTFAENVKEYFDEYLNDYISGNALYRKKFFNIEEMVISHTLLDAEEWESIFYSYIDDEFFGDILFDYGIEPSDHNMHSYIVGMIGDALDIDFYEAPYHPDDLPDRFISKNVNLFVSEDLKAYVNGVNTVINADFYSPADAVLLLQRLSKSLESLKALMGEGVSISSLYLKELKGYYMDRMGVFKHRMKEALAKGLHTCILVTNRDLSLSTDLAPYVQTVYIYSKSGKDAVIEGVKLGLIRKRKIRFSGFEGRFVLVDSYSDNENTIEWLEGAAIKPENEITGDYREKYRILPIEELKSYAVPTMSNFIELEAGSGASFTIEIGDQRKNVDVRIDSKNPLSLNIKNHDPDKWEGKLSLDCSSTVDVPIRELLETFTQSEKYIGRSVEDFISLVSHTKTPNPVFWVYRLMFTLHSTFYIFPTQFDSITDSVVLYMGGQGYLGDKVYTNSRREAPFKVVYLRSVSNYAPFYFLKRDGYILFPPANYPKDQRGKEIVNCIVTPDDVNREGSVYYRCFFPDPEYMSRNIAVESINSEFDIVLVNR